MPETTCVNERGAAVLHVREDETGRMWVQGNGLGNQVDFCPFCGEPAKVKIGTEEPLVVEPAVQRVVEEYMRLIDGCDQERELQAFFGKHLWLLPAGLGLVGDIGVVEQFELGSQFVADFAFVFEVEEQEYAGRRRRGPTVGHNGRIVLVEIESPRVTVFTRGGQFKSDYNQALQQIEDWSTWCASNPVLGTRYSLAGDVQPSFWLIAGRRSDVQGNALLEQRYRHRQSNLPEGLSVCTLDRISGAGARLRTLDAIDAVRIDKHTLRFAGIEAAIRQGKEAVAIG